MRNPLDLWRRDTFNPTRELSTLQRSIDQLFEDFLSPSENSKQLQQASFSPACDIEETDKQYLITFDVPGVSKNDIKLELNDNQLIVSGEKKYEHKEEKKNRYVMERSYGSFQRSFTLPASVDADKIGASYDNGVLLITVPKTEASKAKQIEISEKKSEQTSRKAERAA